MYTSIKGKDLKALYHASYKDEKSNIPNVSCDYDLRQEKPEQQYLDKTYNIDLSSYNEKQLDALTKYFEKQKNKIFDKNIKAIEKWMTIIKDPINAEIKNVKQLETLFNKLIEKKKTKIFFLKQEDGTFFPVLLQDFKSEHDREEGENYFRCKFKFYRIRFKSNKYSDEDEDGEGKIQDCSISRTFYKNDLLVNSADIFNDDSECLSLIDLLKKEDLYIFDEDMMTNYKLEIENFLNLTKKVGHQFVAKGKSLVENGWWFWSDTNYQDVDSRVIIETIDHDILNKCYTFEKKIGLKNEPIPFHPYLKCYDLINHRYLLVAPSTLTEYEYDDHLIDKLVIDDSIKSIIDMVAKSDSDYNDFIKGKSKGRIIMSTGEPGLGKTLTAEVYSETMHKPLYKIQSAQLGDNAEAIEKNLKKILQNAYRWNCVLLIDEADTYVRKRGNDIIQNCIIGVFLRLLEYYEGIMFMTSNKGEEIDDAILSRCTIHIKYPYPNKKQSIEIFEKLATLNKLVIDKKEVEKIIEGYKKISGRSIGVIVKNLKKLSEVKKSKPTAELFKTIEQFIYLHE